MSGQDERRDAAPGCGQAARLSAFIDGELTAAADRALLAHLPECGACAAGIADLARLSAGIRGVQESLRRARPTARFQSVLARLERSRRAEWKQVIRSLASHRRAADARGAPPETRVLEDLVARGRELLRELRGLAGAAAPDQDLPRALLEAEEGESRRRTT